MFVNHVVLNYHFDMLNTFGNSTQGILVDHTVKSATEKSQHAPDKRNAKVTASAVVDAMVCSAVRIAACQKHAHTEVFLHRVVF